MPRKPISIRQSLFLYGFFPMFTCSVLFSIILLTSTTRLMKEKEETSLINRTRVLSNLLDSELKKIKRISLNLAWSDSLKSVIDDYNNLKKTTTDTKVLYYGARRIQKLLDEMVGPLKQIPQVNLILPEGEMICFGMYNLSQQLPEHLHPRLKLLLQNEKNSLWTAPERDFLMEEVRNDGFQRNYISHYQVLYNSGRHPLGIIETKQEVSALFSGLLEITDNFQVFNSRNLQIYPYTLPYGNTYSNIAESISPYRITRKKNIATNEMEILCMGLSTEASWRIITIQNENLHLSPVYRLQVILIPLIFLIAFLGYLISHKLSRGISLSLTNLNRKLNQVQWNRSPEEMEGPEVSGIRELNNLELSFAEMNRKMDEKLDLFVAERTLEVNARMLALQSQMDPHFLFNMLTIIGIMAEDNQTDEIQDVIKHLSSLLRYVSSLEDLTVPLSLERQMAEHYMECISYRFGETVRFEVDIPEGAEDLTVPQYTLIPLLENAVKYGMPDEQTCIVRLSLHTNGNNWFIKAEDNGRGFDKDKLKKLMEKIHKGLKDPQMQLNSHINGMGLFNICARYSLLYGKDFRFEAGNGPDGGALVILGGKKNAH